MCALNVWYVCTCKCPTSYMQTEAIPYMALVSFCAIHDAVKRLSSI